MAEAALEQIVDAEGLVKWFDPRKGFGFLIGPGERDIFVHFSVIQGDGFRVLKDGAAVRYDATRTERGWKATSVRRPDAVELSPVAKRGYTRSPRR